MARSIKRRRLEAKTDYKARLSFLKSGLPRLVVRKSNKYVLAQIVESNEAQDKVLITVNSKDLSSKGWNKDLGSMKNRNACYATGFLIATLAKSKTKKVILDIGMNRNIHKSRIYAVVKGAVDGGLNIPHDKEAFPSDDQIDLKKLQSILNKISNK